MKARVILETLMGNQPSDLVTTMKEALAGYNEPRRWWPTKQFPDGQMYHEENQLSTAYPALAQLIHKFYGIVSGMSIIADPKEIRNAEREGQDWENDIKLAYAEAEKLVRKVEVLLGSQGSGMETKTIRGS